MESIKSDWGRIPLEVFLNLIKHEATLCKLQQNSISNENSTDQTTTGDKIFGLHFLRAFLIYENISILLIIKKMLSFLVFTLFLDFEDLYSKQ